MASEFMECSVCRAKPGTPVLCDACLHNRGVISQQAEQLELLKEKVREDRKVICPQADELNRLGRLERAFNELVASQAASAANDNQPEDSYA